MRSGSSTSNFESSPTGVGKAKSNAGFSMFEMVAFIIISAIVYSTAVNRFNEFPEAAERANFLAVVTQMQTGINLEMMLGFTTGSTTNIQAYANLNPMDMLLKTPNNYLGAFDQVAVEGMPRRSWYFDNSSRELVYLINEADNAFLLINGAEVPTAEIRFHIVVTYRDPVTLRNVTASELSGAASGARISGVVMRPVVPYRWNATEFFSPELLENG